MVPAPLAVMVTISLAPLATTLTLALAVGMGQRRLSELRHGRAGRRAQSAKPSYGAWTVLILSHDVFNERSGTVIAVALTSQAPRASFPLTLELRARGLPKRSWAKISQIRTLSTEDIGKRIARASAEELGQVAEGLHEIISD